MVTRPVRRLSNESLSMEFWLLDINYEVIGEQPVIYMWGITREEKRIVVIEKKFRPYFYVLTDLGSLENIGKHLQPYKLLGIEAVQRKYFGKPTTVIKATLSNPRSVPEARETITNLPGVREVLEADIRFYMRYMVDKKILPSSWLEAKVHEVEVPSGWQVDEAYEIAGDVQVLDEKKNPKLRTYALDIECYNKYGGSDPERDPIIIISRVHDTGEEVFSAENGGERKMIEEFIEDLRTYDPDIVWGYNTNRFDWPYLLKRAHLNGVRLKLGRNNGEPAQSVYGHFSVVGRANVDLYDYASDLQEVKIKTLENVAEFLGILPKSKRVLIDTNKVYEYWDDNSKRDLLRQYALDDARSTYLLGQIILPFGIQLSSLVGLPLDQVFAASVGNRVEWFLIRQAYLFNELVPNVKERREETYQGAIVLKPKPGIHKNIAVLDFSSMYPNVMIKYNVSPDTYIPPEEDIPRDKVWIAPEVGHRFRKDLPGFYRVVLESLIRARKEIRDSMRKLDPRSDEYKILDERQKAIKIITNATYGYSGWSLARWYKREVAEATTAWGRELIKKTISCAENLGLEIIYGDTDSIFVRNDEDKVVKLMDFVERELGFEIKVEKIYSKVFFTEAKKKYCGLLADGRIDVVGFEAARGDWAKISKDVQEEVIRIVLTEEDPWKAVDYIRKVIRELSGGKIPLEKLIIWKTLSKDLEEYEVDAPHVQAAKELKKLGYRVGKGSKVGYVVVKGSGKISEKAKPHIAIKSMDEIDVDYYIKRQIIPAALRILEYFGIREEHFWEGKRQASITDFF